MAFPYKSVSSPRDADLLFQESEEAIKRAKAAGKRPGCWYGGITLRSGKKGWAIYKDGKVVEQYAVM